MKLRLLIGLSLLCLIPSLSFAQFDNRINGCADQKAMVMVSGFWDCISLAFSNITACSDDQTIVSDGSTNVCKSIPDCDDSSGQHLNYDTTGNAFVCGTTGSGGANHNLLDASVHPDTVAQSVSRGSLLYGNVTPKWDELLIGTANKVLGTDGTDASWLSLILASAYFANQGTTTTVLHGNAAGNLSWGPVVPADVSGALADANVDGSLEADEVNPTLGSQTQGVYVGQVADGTGIDGTANAEGATYTPSVDLTEITCTPPLSCPAATTLTTSMATSRLIGRTTALTGVMEEIVVNSPLTLLAGALDIAAIADTDLANNYSGVGTCTAGYGVTATVDNGPPGCDPNVVFMNEPNSFSATQTMYAQNDFCFMDISGGDQYCIQSESAAPAGTIILTLNIDPATCEDTKGKLTINASNEIVCAAVTGPVFSGVRVYNNANQSINNGTWTSITFNTETQDTDAYHSTSSNTSRLTAPVTGNYRVWGGIQWASNATGWRYIRILIDGTTITRWGIVATINGSVTTSESAVTVSLTAGQYVELQGYQDSGGALNSETAGIYAPVFGMEWVR